MIKLSDNSWCKIPDDVAIKLRRFAGLTLEELCSDNPELLVFPQCLGENGDKIGESRLFSFAGEGMYVGNVVGFWGVDDIHVRVHSRFDDDDRQYFFHYMLQRVSGVNVLNMNTLPDDGSIWDFLIYLFPMALKRALVQGVFRAYRVFEYDDDHVRGHIDVPRFVRNDVPFAGRISYSTREHTANNHVIQLVRHTIEFIRRRNPMLLSVDIEMRQAVETIVRLTPDYEEHTRAKIVSRNLRPVCHPYYSAYTALQKICLAILRHERISFGESDGRICGIVFDAAWLWEEYLAKMFADNVKTSRITHSENKRRTSPIYFFRPNRSPHYPDFYDDERRIVLDAKYKHLEGEIGRADLFQLISYLHVKEYDRGALIFPADENKYLPDGELNGFGGKVGRLSFAVPRGVEKATFRDFVLAACESEHDFVDLLMNGQKAWCLSGESIQ